MLRKPSTKRSAGKRRANGSVDEYLAGVGEPGRSVMEKMRATIRAALPPDASETISYGIPAFKRNRVLMWYGAFATHCSLFPTAEVIDDFKEELKAYKISKGTIQFPLDKPLPTTLIKRIVKARVKRA